MYCAAPVQALRAVQCVDTELRSSAEITLVVFGTSPLFHGEQERTFRRVLCSSKEVIDTVSPFAGVVKQSAVTIRCMQTQRSSCS